VPGFLDLVYPRTIPAYTVFLRIVGPDNTLFSDEVPVTVPALASLEEASQQLVKKQPLTSRRVYRLNRFR
jgi:hypothetical protein